MHHTHLKALIDAHVMFTNIMDVDASYLKSPGTIPVHIISSHWPHGIMVAVPVPVEDAGNQKEK